MRFRGFFIFRLFWQILDYAQYFYPVTPAVTLAKKASTHCGQSLFG
nr:MAG TPA: hypothetical protein [Caudoviricetes sp.]